MTAADPKILVTGASGFIGSALLTRLQAKGMRPRATTRRGSPPASRGVEWVSGVNLEADSDWTRTLTGCGAVIHAAGRAHVMREASADAASEYRRANVDGTLRLASQAAKTGVRRFIFLSSIKVNGEETRPGHPFTADDAPAPLDAYGRSKHEAEEALRALAQRTGMEVVVVRPVLVYGPGVKANFRSMMRWLARGLPLPLGAVRNRRSLVSITNLVDLIIVSLQHPAAANETFLVSDDEDLSTTELLRRTARAMGRRARLLPAPPQLLQLGAAFVGKGAVVRRLLSSLQVDISRTKQRLGWTPPESVDDGLQTTAQWFLAHERVGE